MAVASSWDFWWPLFVIGGLTAVILGGFRARVTLLCIGLCIGVVDGIVVKSLKDLVGRPRPYMVVNDIRVVDLAKASPRILAAVQPPVIEYSRAMIGPVRGGSFPSGHAANNFTLATVVIYFYRRWGWLMLVPALLVSYSRIYVGSHWPIDTVVAALIGVGLSLLVLAGLETLWRKFAPKWLPKLAAAHPCLRS